MVLFDLLVHKEKEPKQRYATLALWSLGLAILAEICAYPYGERSDELSRREIAELAKVAGTANATAKGFEAQIADANARAEEARSMAQSEITSRESIEVELLRLRLELADRHLPRGAASLIRTQIEGSNRLVQDQERTVTREIWVESVQEGEARRLCGEIYAAMAGVRNVPVRERCTATVQIPNKIHDGVLVKRGMAATGGNDEQFAKKLAETLGSLDGLGQVQLWDPSDGSVGEYGYDTQEIVGFKPKSNTN